MQIHQASSYVVQNRSLGKQWNVAIFCQGTVKIARKVLHYQYGQPLFRKETHPYKLHNVGMTQAAQEVAFFHVSLHYIVHPRIMGIGKGIVDFLPSVYNSICFHLQYSTVRTRPNLFTGVLSVGKNGCNSEKLELAVIAIFVSFLGFRRRPVFEKTWADVRGVSDSGH